MAGDSAGQSKSEIEADLAGARARLSGNLESLIDEMHPKHIADRQLENAKGIASEEFSRAKSQIKDDDGWRTDRLALIGGSIAGIVAFLLIVRALVRKVRR